MPVDLTVDADLEFSIDIPGSRTVSGALTGSGKVLELRVSDQFLATARGEPGSIRRLAAGLAGQGLLVSVVSPSGPLVTLGAVRTSWLQRWVTGSRHIRIKRLVTLWSLARGRNPPPTVGAASVGTLAPPPTLFPIAPTMVRRPRRPVTTTHDPQRGGNPRMVMAARPHPKPDDPRMVFPLRDDTTTIGSGPDCHVRLPRLEPLHAEIRHDEDDEFVLVRIGRPDDTRVNGARVHTAVLRTGSRVELGEWTMSFQREEFADHGRPYGGRIGGELGHQRAQPSRARLQGRKEGDR